MPKIRDSLAAFLWDDCGLIPIVRRIVRKAKIAKRDIPQNWNRIFCRVATNAKESGHHVRKERTDRRSASYPIRMSHVSVTGRLIGKE